MVEQPQTIGRGYTCAHPDFMTYADYVRLFARVVGREPVLVCIPSDVILAVRVPEMANNLLDELTRFNVAFSIRRFLADFPDFQFEPLEDAARRAVEWNFAQGHVTHTDVIDDHIIAAYQACLRDFTVG